MMDFQTIIWVGGAIILALLILIPVAIFTWHYLLSNCHIMQELAYLPRN